MNIFSRRLAHLRTERGLSQREFAKELSNRLSNLKGKTISTVTISSYEQGKRYPIFETLVEMAKILDVSIDYLAGISDTPTSLNNIPVYNEANETIDLTKAKIIGIRELKKYDKSPIYVVFDLQKNMGPRWCILDYFNRRLVSTNEYIPIGSSMKFYLNEPLEYRHTNIIGKSPLTMGALKKTEEPVWVELINAEGIVAGEYRGWYSHNESHSCLINTANGLTLKYEGCCISYNAFRK